MTKDGLLPKGENFRRAIAWLLKQPKRDAKTVEEACQRFDISPLDEEFLLQHLKQPEKKSFKE